MQARGAILAGGPAIFTQRSAIERSAAAQRGWAFADEAAAQPAKEATAEVSAHPRSGNGWRTRSVWGQERSSRRGDAK